MQIAITDRLTCPPEVLSRVLDGEAVLLHLGSGTYFGMNEVATRAWEMIVSGTTFASLCSSLEEEFEVESNDLERDMREFVGALIDKRLVTVTPS
ncbi:MAG: PqqD family protein [Polyangiaceae bacterium]|nr:PqqD family protein [Polyangiaceae bacterium]